MAVVDADLVEALKEGHLVGAVIDVCRQERCLASSFLDGLGLAADRSQLGTDLAIVDGEVVCRELAGLSGR